jgi:hypothetical protein
MNLAAKQGSGWGETQQLLNYRGGRSKGGAMAMGNAFSVCSFFSLDEPGCMHLHPMGLANGLFIVSVR